MNNLLSWAKALQESPGGYDTALYVKKVYLPDLGSYSLCRALRNHLVLTHNRIPFLSLWPLYAPVRCESNKKVYSHYTRGEHEADKVSDAQPKLDHICFEIKRIVHTDPSPLSPGGKTEGPSFFRSRMSKDLSSSHSSEQKQLCFLPVSSSEIT